MGRLGAGNFDDDLAKDFLADIIAGHERFVERIFAGDTLQNVAYPNFFDVGDCFLMPTISIIICLGKYLRSDYLPSTEVVSRWEIDYLNRIDALLPEGFPDPVHQEWFRNVRRPVIMATFKELYELSKELYTE